MQRIWVQPGCPEHYLGRHGEIPVKRNGLSIGFASLPVCVYLVGQPWDDFALSCIETLKPSSIRVSTGEITTDSWLDRVTVMLDKDRLIESVVQECAINLPESCQNGYDFKMALKQRELHPSGV